MVLFIIPFNVFQTNILTSDGYNSDLWTMSITIFTSLMFVVHNKLLITQQYHDSSIVATYFFVSYGLYFLYLIVTDDWHEFKQEYFTFEMLFKNSP